MKRRDISFKRLLIDDVIIQRKLTGNKDEINGYSNKYETITKVKGRITTTSGSASERFNTDQDVADIDNILFLLPNVDIKKNDRVFGKDKFYHVDSVIEPSFMKHHIEALLIETQPDTIDEVTYIENNTNITSTLSII